MVLHPTLMPFEIDLTSAPLPIAHAKTKPIQVFLFAGQSMGLLIIQVLNTVLKTSQENIRLVQMQSLAIAQKTRCTQEFDRFER